MLAVLASLLGRFAWLLDLFSHFRVQYSVLLLLLAVALFGYRLRSFAALALVGAAISAIPVAAYVGVPARSAAAGSRNFRLVTFNTWFRNDDMARVAKYLESTDADAIVLEELNRQKATQLQALLPSYPHAFIQGGHRNGAVVFARWPMLMSEEVALSADGVRAARVDLVWRDATITLVGVHLYWPLGPRNSRVRNRDLRELASVVRTQSGPLVIAGDFNVTPWSAHFRDALASSGMNDAGRGFGIVPTWPAQFPPLGIGIDHCLTSPHWRTVDVRTGPFLGSDHRPLIVDLELKPEGTDLFLTAVAGHIDDVPQK